jgi:4-hydroxybenzoate polyprenyltransferase
MNETPTESKPRDHTWLIVLFQIGFFVALWFGGRYLGANIIWLIIGMALLSGVAMFVCFLVVGLDGLSQERGFWRKALLILIAAVMAIAMMYFYSRFSV